MTINKLFITGCPRSGTTALAELIGAHSKIVMGIERYGHLERANNFKLNESLFQPDRFQNIQPGDTFYSDFNKFHNNHAEISLKLHNYNKLSFIGDKRPTLYEVYDKVFKEFPNAKFIYIYRNIHEVAASWNKRARGSANWLKENDYREAVKEWNKSIENTINAIDAYPNQIVVIKYEDIFNYGSNLESLYSWLRINIDDETIRKFDEIIKASSIKAKNRDNLPKDQRDYCNKYANFEQQKHLDNIKLIF